MLIRHVARTDLSKYSFLTNISYYKNDTIFFIFYHQPYTSFGKITFWHHDKNSNLTLEVKI